MMVSVAMASYNGEKYIRQQLESVLMNLSEDDEIIISDDGSSDRTIEVIESLCDDRIKIVKGPGKGINQNFANAVKNCSGDYIFLCDQDDIWYENKVRTVISAFQQNNCILIEHDAVVVDSNGKVIYESFFNHRRVRTGLMKNIIRNAYHGCCMAFKSELKDLIFPIPDSGCLHDQWIGLIAELHGKTMFLHEILMEYKRHGDNASSFEHYPFGVQLKNRILLIKHLFQYVFKDKCKSNL